MWIAIIFITPYSQLNIVVIYECIFFKFLVIILINDSNFFSYFSFQTPLRFPLFADEYGVAL